MLIDSHCHLEGAKFAADRGAVLQRARQAGVDAVLCIGNGNGPDEVNCALKLKEEFESDSVGGTVPEIHASIGIHPHEARLARPSHYEHMGRLARDPRVIAWGEIGLDYFYDHSPRDLQREVFIKQLDMAREAALPVIIHCRPSEVSPGDAWDDCLGLIERRFAPARLGGVLHCFTGQREHARAALDFGFHISFAGNITFPKAQNIREAAVEAPLDRILVETDAPYLAPVPHRGQRNEPVFVLDTARYIAQLRGIPVEQLGSATSESFYRLFPRARA
ncbi:MAG: TatD family hydrolase [Acidobacteria bacterium]|nr:TatD family hydrolase [Acidobacteriota bacterium]